ncbi:myosin heavy, partial [Cystoisospora suis]
MLTEKGAIPIETLYYNNPVIRLFSCGVCTLDSMEGSSGGTPLSFSKTSGLAVMRLKQQRRQMQVLSELTKSLCDETKKSLSSLSSASSSSSSSRLPSSSSPGNLHTSFSSSSSSASRLPEGLDETKTSLASSQRSFLHSEELEDLKSQLRAKDSQILASQASHEKEVYHLGQKILHLETDLNTFKSQAKESGNEAIQRVLQVRSELELSRQTASDLAAKVERLTEELAQAKSEKRALQASKHAEKKTENPSDGGSDLNEDEIQKIKEQLRVEVLKRNEAQQMLTDVSSELQGKIQEIQYLKETHAKELELDITQRALYEEMKKKCKSYTQEIECLKKEVAGSAREEESVRKQKKYQHDLEETIKELRKAELSLQQKDVELEEWRRLAGSFVLDENPTREAFRRYLLLLVNSLQALQFEKSTALAKSESIERDLSQKDLQLKTSQDTVKTLEMKVEKAEKKELHMKREIEELKQHMDILKIRLTGALHLNSSEEVEAFLSRGGSLIAEKRRELKETREDSLKKKIHGEEERKENEELDRGDGETDEKENLGEGGNASALIRSLKLKVKDLEDQLSTAGKLTSHLESLKSRLQGELQAAQQKGELSLTLQRERDDLAS